MVDVVDLALTIITEMQNGTVVPESCTACSGSGYVESGRIDLSDINDKLNDLKEKVDEIKETLDGM